MTIYLNGAIQQFGKISFLKQNSIAAPYLQKKKTTKKNSLCSLRRSVAVVTPALRLNNCSQEHGLMELKWVIQVV